MYHHTPWWSIIAQPIPTSMVTAAIAAYTIAAAMAIVVPSTEIVVPAMEIVVATEILAAAIVAATNPPHRNIHGHYRKPQ